MPEPWLIGFDTMIGLLPALAGLLTGYVEFAGYEEDVREHVRTKHLYERAAECLKASNDVEEQQLVVRHLGIEALQETANWALLHKTKNVKT
jgi:hypothetical protein